MATATKTRQTAKTKIRQTAKTKTTAKKTTANKTTAKKAEAKKATSKKAPAKKTEAKPKQTKRAEKVNEKLSEAKEAGVALGFVVKIPNQKTEGKNFAYAERIIHAALKKSKLIIANDLVVLDSSFPWSDIQDA